MSARVWRTTMVHPVTEWVRVAGETAIIARESGEVSFHALDRGEAEVVALAERMTGGGTLVSTTGLLDGASSLAFQRAGRRAGRTQGGRGGGRADPLGA